MCLVIWIITGLICWKPGFLKKRNNNKNRTFWGLLRLRKTKADVIFNFVLSGFPLPPRHHITGYLVQDFFLVISQEHCWLKTEDGINFTSGFNLKEEEEEKHWLYPLTVSRGQNVPSLYFPRLTAFVNHRHFTEM